MTDKPLKVEFAPGCFDHFEGSQEELNELMAEIHRLVESGELFERSVPVEELSDEEFEFIEQLTNNEGTRNLQ
jgi:hypothetical protein